MKSHKEDDGENPMGVFCKKSINYQAESEPTKTRQNVKSSNSLKVDVNFIYTIIFYFNGFCYYVYVIMIIDIFSSGEET